MFLCYVDESGHTGDNLTDSRQPKLVLGGLLVEDRVWRDVERDVSTIRAKAAKHLATAVPELVKKDSDARKIWSKLVAGHRTADAQEIEERLEPFFASGQFELHGGPLIGARGAFFQIEKARRARWVRDCISILEKRKLKVIASVVDKGRLQERGRKDPLGLTRSADRYAWDGLLDTFERFLVKQNSHGLLVSDQVQNPGDHRSRLLRLQREDGPLFGAHHVIDTIHFVDSKASSLIQLADIATYLVAKIHIGVPRHLRAECERIEALVHHTSRI